MIGSHAPNDCGVSAIANAFGITWKDAKNLIWPKGHKGQNFYTTTKILIEAAKRFGIKVRQHKLIINRDRSWPTTVSIVKVKPRGCKKHNWHWVTCDGEYVYDNHYDKPIPITEYKLKPLGYIELL